MLVWLSWMLMSLINRKDSSASTTCVLTAFIRFQLLLLVFTHYQTVDSLYKTSPLHFTLELLLTISWNIVFGYLFLVISQILEGNVSFVCVCVWEREKESERVKVTGCLASQLSLTVIAVIDPGGQTLGCCTDWRTVEDWTFILLYLGCWE